MLRPSSARCATISSVINDFSLKSESLILLQAHPPLHQPDYLREVLLLLLFPLADERQMQGNAVSRFAASFANR